MPNPITVIGAISTALIATLADGSYPALTDGRILVGRQHVYEASSPPRVVFVPVRSEWGPRTMFNASPVAGKTSDQRQQWVQRAIWTDITHYEVHVWGASVPADPDLDFVATQQLYQAVIYATHSLMPGCYNLVPGDWADQRASASQMVKAGHEFVFGLQIYTPVTDNPFEAALQFVPSDTTANPTVVLQPPDGSPPEPT